MKIGEGNIDNRTLLEQAGLAASYDNWKSVATFGGWVAAIAAIIGALGGLALFVGNQQSSSLATQAENLGKQRDVDTMKKPYAAWPNRLLTEKAGFTATPLEDGLTLFVDKPPTAGPLEIPAPTNLILRRDEENVAWAQAIPFGQRYVWPYAQVSDHLEDGKAQVEIRTVVKDTGISDFLRSTGESPAEIIGVGLESSDGGDPKDEIRQLSIDRAINLLAAVSQAIELPHTPKRIYYRQLGLGRARRSELKESEPERKQRSALVIVVAFLRQDTATQSTEQTLETLLRRLPLQQINLMDYEFSYAMAERMGERLAIGSAPRGDRWEHPPITVEQAIARRPKDSGAN